MLNSSEEGKYLSPLVSCLECKAVKSAKGLFTHFIINHTEEGKKKHRETVQAASKLGGKAIAAKLRTKKKEHISSYQEEPSLCEQCNIILPFNKRHNKFCSRSCSAKHTNTHRDPVCYIKSSETLKETLANKIRVPRLQYTKLKQCPICKKLHPRSGKTCSDECKSILLSNRMIERIKLSKRSNYRRDKKSYLESSFETWLKENNISLVCKPEYTIRNHITKKWYFVDFYFPEIDLIVELDGKQHEKEKHKEADILRDEYIKSHLNINIFRITHNEYVSGSKIQELLKLLVRQEGIEPSRALMPQD